MIESFCSRKLEMVFLGQHIGDYPGICQGKTRIPGVNDGEEFELTDVSCGAGPVYPNQNPTPTRNFCKKISSLSVLRITFFLFINSTDDV